MLAGTSVSRLSSLFGSENIIRIMPNTPIKVGKGTTLVYDHPKCKKDFKDHLRQHFKSSGIIECKSERDLDILTTFSGCGPAYIFLFADTLMKKMSELGYEDSISRQLINTLFEGASSLMSSSEEKLTTLLDQVTSKGGVTIEAINTYRDSDIYDSTSSAIEAAIKKSDELNQVT